MISAYYTNYASYIGISVFGVHLAELFGPLWGGLLFKTLGYSGIFIVQSAVVIVIGLVLLCYFRAHEQSHPLR